MAGNVEILSSTPTEGCPFAAPIGKNDKMYCLPTFSFFFSCLFFPDPYPNFSSQILKGVDKSFVLLFVPFLFIISRHNVALQFPHTGPMADANLFVLNPLLLLDHSSKDFCGSSQLATIRSFRNTRQGQHRQCFAISKCVPCTCTG